MKKRVFGSQTFWVRHGSASSALWPPPPPGPAARPRPETSRRRPGSLEAPAVFCWLILWFWWANKTTITEYYRFWLESLYDNLQDPLQNGRLNIAKTGRLGRHDRLPQASPRLARHCERPQWQPLVLRSRRSSAPPSWFGQPLKKCSNYPMIKNGADGFLTCFVPWFKFKPMKRTFDELLTKRPICQSKTCFSYHIFFNNAKIS